MPSNIQHTAQAAHNERLLLHLRQQAIHAEYGDWYVTVAFYAAIHHVEAMLFTKKQLVRDTVIKHSTDVRKILGSLSDHGAREWLLRRVFRNLYDPYMNLYQLSQVAKYACHVPNESDWSVAVSLLERMKVECEIARIGQK